MGPGGFSSFFRDLCDFGVSADDFVVIIRIMGNKAVRAVFDALFRITEIASAAFAQCVQRTVTEQAVKTFRVGTLMAGKIFTFSMAEEFIIFTHLFLPIHPSETRSVRKPGFPGHRSFFGSVIS